VTTANAGQLLTPDATTDGVIDCRPASGMLGVLFNSTNFTSLAGFTPNGATPTIVGSALQFSGGMQDFTHSFDFDQYTTLPLWSQTGTITVGSQSSTSVGLGLGTRSYEVGGALLGVVGYVDLTTGTITSGHVYVTALSGGTGVTLANAPTPLSISAGDVVQVQVTRNYNIITTTATDLTTNAAPVIASATYSLAAGAPALLPNLGRFAVYNFGGTQTLTSLNISSAAPVGADVVLVGDSKTVPYYAGIMTNAWSAAVGASIRSVTEAGGSDESADALLNLPEIEALKPNNVVLNIGRNDYCTGTSVGTVLANIESFTTQLEALGIKVYQMLPLYETVCDQSALTSAIAGEYPSTSFTANVEPGFSSSSPDGIHPGTIAQPIIYNAITSYLQGKGINFIYPNYQQYEMATGVLNPNRIIAGGPLEDGGGTYLMGYGFPKTNTTLHRVGSLAQSNDNTSPFGLFVDVQGSATSGDESITMDTGHDGIDNTGVLNVQTGGGFLNVGAYTPNTPTTVITGLGQINFVIPVAYEAFNPTGIGWGIDLSTNTLTTANYGWEFLHTPGATTTADDFSLYVAPPPAGTALSKVVTFRGDLSTTFAGVASAANLIDRGLISQPCIGTSSTGQLQAGTGCSPSAGIEGNIQDSDGAGGFQDSGIASTNVATITGTFGAWTQTTPIPTCGTGSGTLSSALRVGQVGKTASYSLTVTIASVGTCAGAISVGFPFTAESSAVGSCRGNTTGTQGYIEIPASQTSGFALNYAGATLATTEAGFTCSGTVEIQ